ncbi:phytosulfokines-like [Ipomoea triloba]|uniref:phytosulfokines-like n=1 Tax=Ipomoea triloba TaxID=35885 RepID=UPI00125DBA21|nr:phytosulfokines-like [Ipomoea triloba]GLL38975.1 phytosulfokines-like [Ipomoea trifida]GMD49704.1 phytosulfokines 3-like [Ipomoea batatas]GMD51703.1 phytosulfokines 3-like [Ipomoea batatas]GMD53849.1 phytosulfokines 3-like [Ipomoea batatas]GMD55197.1 phytosulfokines 3-like [Ipomoea batatas]
MSPSKTTTFFIVALLLLFTLSSASRPLPESREATTLNKTQHEVIEKEESCKGVGEEECLMRRTLAAHLDYIYTQKENKP